MVNDSLAIHATRDVKHLHIVNAHNFPRKSNYSTNSGDSESFIHNESIYGCQVMGDMCDGINMEPHIFTLQNQRAVVRRR